MLIPLALLTAAAFEIVSLSPGVYAALVEPTPPMYVFANALVILDEEGVTVVDAVPTLKTRPFASGAAMQAFRLACTALST